MTRTLDRHEGDHTTDPGRLACDRARHRLRGGWGDPAAWRILREELARVWSDTPGVSFSLLLSRGTAAQALYPIDAPTSCVVWQRPDARAQWVTPPNAAGDLWQRLQASPERQVCGRGSDIIAWGLPSDLSRGCGGWFAAGYPDPESIEQIILLGLDEPHGQDAALARQLGAALATVGELLAPLLGFRRLQAETTSLLTAARAEAEALTRIERLRGRLAAVAAHELKTPLTSIMAYTDVLATSIDDPSFQHGEEFLAVLRTEADRLLRMVDRLLDFSHRDRSRPLLKRRPCHVGALLQDTLRALAPQTTVRDQHLSCRLAAGLPAVAGDPDLLRQVFINLVGNAIKFTPDGGRIAIAAREDAALMRISVTDSGPGIPPGELRAIFQSFYRTQSAASVPGSGLGLSIVKDIVDLHDGFIDVRSRPGRGSVFTVLLPKVQHHSNRPDRFAAAGVDPSQLRAIHAYGLRLAAELTDGRATAICMRTGEGGALAPRASQGLPRVRPGMVLPDPDGRLAHVMTTGEVVHEAPGGKAVPWPTLPPAPDDTGWLAAPLVSGGETLGIVLAARRAGAHTFSDDEAVMLRVVGEALGAALTAVERSCETSTSPAAVGEALRVLGNLRRSGVPTADPFAMRLLTRTAYALGMGGGEIRHLQYAVALHDVGMADVDHTITMKSGNLSHDERDEVGRHPRRGLDVLGPLVAVPELRDVILHHHERVDGTGYPEGRAGGDIPLGARILAVVDAFFAMISQRPWRDRRPLSDVITEIQRQAGTQFDPVVVAAFCDVLRAEGLVAAPTSDPVTSRGKD